MEVNDGVEKYYICLKEVQIIPKIELSMSNEEQLVDELQHMEQHEPASSLDHPYASMAFFCHNCQVPFTTKTGFTLHQRRIHGKGLESDLEMKERIESNPVIEPTYPCTACDSCLKSKKTLKKHMRLKHQVNVDPPARSNIKCLLCSMTVSRAKDLTKHYSETHEINLEFENHCFKTYEEFQQWKKEIEVEASSLFVKYSGDKRHSDGKFVKQIFSCQRSGHFISHGVGQRRLKRNGSIKINGHCPARIQVTKWKDGLIEVNFTKTHLGHENPPSSHSVEEHRVLEEAKTKLGKEINNMIFQCRTIEELEEIKKSLEPARATIAVMKRKRRRAELRAQFGSIPRNKKKLVGME